MLNKVIIIFSGFNQRAIIAFLRTLEANKLQYAIIAKSNTDTIFLTNYKDKVIAVRKSVPLVLGDLLKSISVVKNKIKANEMNYIFKIILKLKLFKLNIKLMCGKDSKVIKSCSQETNRN